MRPIVTALLFGLILPAVARGDEKQPPIKPEDPKLGRAVDFERDVYPILDASCVACHNVAIDESKLVLEDVESILKGGKRGPAVVKNKPDESLLYLAASRNKKPHMPPSPNDVDAPPLTPKQLGIIRQWITEGANKGSGGGKSAVSWNKVPASIHASFSVAITEDGRFAAVSRANRIYIYDLVTQAEAAVLHDPLLDQIQVNGETLYGPQEAHQDFVHALAFDPAGHMLASSGYRNIKLWERPGNVRNWQSGLSGDITAVAVDAERNVAAVGTSDYKIVLVNLADGKPIREIPGHKAAVTGLAFSADGTKLYSGSKDKTLAAWNVADGAKAGEIVTPAEVLAVALNKDGNRIVAGQQDNKLRVYDLPGVAKPAEGQSDIKPLAELNGHGGPVTTVLTFPTDGNQIVSGSADGTARLWRLDNGQNVRTINHGAPVNAVDISADGTRIVTAGANGVAQVWQTDNGQKKAEVKGVVDRIENAAVLAERFEVAKQRVGLADGKVKAEEKAVKEREEGLKKAKEAQTKADKALAEAQEKLKKPQEAYDAAKKAFDAKTDDKELEKKLKDAQTALNKEKDNVKKAEEAKKVADNSVRLSEQSLKNAQQSLADAKKAHESETKRQTDAEAANKAAAEAVTAAVKPLHSVSFTAGGKMFLTGSEDGSINLWQTDTGKPLETYSGTNGSVSRLVTVDANRVLAASADKQLTLWNVNPGWRIAGRLGPPSDKPLDLTDSICEDRVLSLAFSHDGTKLVSGGGEPSRSGELILWDVPNRKLVRKFEDAHSDTVLGVEFSFDDTEIVSGAADKFAKIFSVETGKLIRAFEGHTHHVMDVSIKADGSELATAGADNAIKIWTVATGEQRRTINNYSKQVTSIQYYGDKNQILSCSGDKNVKLHTTSNGSQTRAYGGAGDYQYAAATDRDLSIVVAAGADGVLRVWNGTNGQSIVNFAPPAPPEGQQASK